MLELKSVYPLLPPCSAGGQESEGHWQAAMSERSVPLGVVFQFLLALRIGPQPEILLDLICMIELIKE